MSKRVKYPSTLRLSAAAAKRNATLMPGGAIAGGLSEFVAAFQAGGKELPGRLLVAPWGTTQTRLGPVVVDEYTAQVLPLNNRAAKRDVVALDFAHNTVKTQKNEHPVKVAGFGTPEIVPGEGIYLTKIEFTPEGVDALSGGHYPDISPAVVRNAKGQVVYLHSAAACQHGEIDGLTLFSSADTVEDLLAQFDASDPDDDGAEQRDLREVLIDLLNALGAEPKLTAEASDGEIATAAEDVAALIREPAATTNQPDPSTQPKIDSMEAKKFEERLDKLEASIAGDKRQHLIARAAREGKVIPLSAAQIDELSVDTLSAMVDGLPVTVPMESRIEGAVDNFSAKGDDLTAEDKHVAALMGVDLAAKK